MRENIFLTLGSPLVDIIAAVDEDFLSKYNLKPNNAVAVTGSHKSLFKDLQKFHTKYVAGGCALNTARTLQWALKTPYISTVVGAIGRDSYGGVLKQQLNEERVKYIFEEIEGETTGKCAVLLTEGNRSLCTDLGASKCFHLEHLKAERFWSAVEQAQYYYVPGFFLGVSLDCLRELAKHSAREGKMFAFNLSAPFLFDLYKKEIEELLPFIDILFGNDSEARAFARATGCESNSLQEILLHFRDLGWTRRPKGSITVITRGPDPVCLVQGNKIREYPVTRLEEGEIKDTSAAGDAFVGGFMAQFILENTLEECVIGGISAADKIIRSVGCSI